MTQPRFQSLPPDAERHARALLSIMSIRDAARESDLPRRFLEDVSRTMSRDWLLIDNRTGRTWAKRTERSCYLHAQILGLTDYTFGRGQA